LSILIKAHHPSRTVPLRNIDINESQALRYISRIDLGEPCLTVFDPVGDEQTDIWVPTQPCRKFDLVVGLEIKTPACFFEFQAGVKPHEAVLVTSFSVDGALCASKHTDCQWFISFLDEVYYPVVREIRMRES